LGSFWVKFASFFSGYVCADPAFWQERFPQFTQITYEPSKAKLISKAASVNLHPAVMPLSTKPLLN
jgi:hypothetical protein